MCSKSNHQSHDEKHQVVVVVVPLPAQGHLNQLLHLSRLILLHNIPVHYVATPINNLQARNRVQGWDPNSISNLHFHDFNVPPFLTPLPNPNAETKFPYHLLPSIEASSHLRQPVASLLKSLSSAATTRRVIVIHDSLMASVTQDASEIPNAENYTFHSCSALELFLRFWEEMGKPSSVEGIPIIEEFPSFEGNVPAEFLDFVYAQLEFLKFNDGNIYNTSRAIEGRYMDLIERITSSNKHWALGPFNPLAIEKKNDKVRHFSLEWLDKQEAESVIYISFGTTTAFTDEEIKEISKGLEQSKQKFIWVLRDADKGDVFDAEVRRYELPDGFEERIEGRGLIVREWAPQLEILSHDSTGGFMSHCGWNSCMESISMGVPMAVWPMHSDQPNNSFMITQALKMGLVVREWDRRNEIVNASEVENAVRRLMASKEGDEMRNRALNLKDAVRRSMDDGGVSRLEMENFIAHITR